MNRKDAPQMAPSSTSSSEADRAACPPVAAVAMLEAVLEAVLDMADLHPVIVCLPLSVALQAAQAHTSADSHQSDWRLAMLRSGWLPALAAFEAAARHQNFAHAAEELSLTAGAVSHHVRKLEGWLGTPLFHRHARGVLLTPAGRRLADAAGSSLSDLDDVVRGIRSSRDEQRVRIATLHSWTVGWLQPRLPGFVAAHASIRLGIEAGDALSRFDEGGPALGIRHGGGQWPGLSATLLMDATLFPVAAPDYPGLEALRTPRDIARARLITDAG